MSMGADGFVAEGYVACSACGDWTVKAGRKSATCADCAALMAHTAQMLEEANAIVGRSAPRRPTRGKPKRKPTAAQRAKRREWNAARSAALQRLARIHHPLYEVLLAEEKARRGLDPGIDIRPPGAAPLERAMADRATAEDAA